MKTNIIKSITVLIIIFLFFSFLASEPSNSRKPMFMNFQKLVLYHSKSTNEYYLVVTATDDSTRVANFDTLNAHVKLDMLDGEPKFIDNENIKITPLGNMYNQVIGAQNTLFRFNLIIDNSGSIDQQNLQFVKHALTRFIELVPLVFEAQILRFSNLILLKTPFTKDKNQLKDSINKTLFRGGTALFDAMDIGIQELKSKQDEIPLRFSVVLTDGKDNSSRSNPDPHSFKNKIVNDCKKNHIPLFIVGVTDNVDSKLLAEMAKFGFYQHIKNFPDIDKAFHVILNLIKDTYVFKIPAVGDFQNIKTLYIVKKGLTGKHETIQDIIVN